MKQVVYCENCKKIIRRQGSFNALLERDQVLNGMRTGQIEKVKIRLCRNCTFEAGYKVKEKNDS